MYKKCHPKIGAHQLRLFKFMVSSPPTMLSRAVEYMSREKKRVLMSTACCRATHASAAALPSGICRRAKNRCCITGFHQLCSDTLKPSMLKIRHWRHVFSKFKQNITKLLNCVFLTSISLFYPNCFLALLFDINVTLSSLCSTKTMNQVDSKENRNL